MKMPVMRRPGRTDGAGQVMERLDALDRALDVGADRLDPRAAAQARRVLGRTGERMKHGAQNTVVALAGATGSGKSSLFNAITGTSLARTGARRPTTATPAGVIVDDADVTVGDGLLDWLDVGTRHRMQSNFDDVDLTGLVLLDLPDHDSTEHSHQVTVDRMVGLVDLLIWVVDPQKYADDALHSRYLRNLVSHQGVMLVVLNQVDRLPPGAAGEVLDDVRRLLASEGLSQVRVFATSAATGEGVPELRAAVAEAVAKHEVMLARVAADVDASLHALRQSVAAAEHAPDRLPGREQLIGAFSAAAGVPMVLKAVRNSYLRDANGVMGWPFTRWARHLKPDPMRRLGLERRDTPQLERTSIPQASGAQRAQVDLALRALARQTGEGLPQRWALAVRDAADPGQASIGDALDQAISGVDLRGRRPVWWHLFGVLQLLLAAGAVFGFLWLAVVFVVAWAQLPPLPTPRWRELPWPTWMLFGGLVLGLVLAVLARVLAGMAAGWRRRRAERAIRTAIGTVADQRVLGPVREVLEQHRLTRQALGVGK